MVLFEALDAGAKNKGSLGIKIKFAQHKVTVQILPPKCNQIHLGIP